MRLQLDGEVRERRAISVLLNNTEPMGSKPDSFTHNKQDFICL